jgi:hypothetical protein
MSPLVTKVEIGNSVQPDVKESVDPLEAQANRVREKYKYLEEMGAIVYGSTGFRIVINSTVKTLEVGHETREIFINPKFVEGRDLTNEEELYTLIHEVAHLVQLAQDPDGYVKTFEIAKEKSKKWPKEKQKSVEKAWLRYFNFFVDVHDNSITERRMPKFQNLDDPTHPRYTLYRKLFPPTDFTNLPQHLQFIHAALRKTMIPEEEIIVSESVEDLLNRPFSYLGKKYNSLYEFIGKKIFSGSEDFSVILHRLETVIQPLFEKLLNEDANNGDFEPQSGSNDNLDFDEMITEDVAKEIAKGIKEINKSTSQRMKDKMTEEFRKKMEGAKFNATEIRRMEEIMEHTSDVFRDMEELWRAFVHFSSNEVWVDEAGYKSGVTISYEEFVRQLPTILSRPADSRIFERRVGVESERIIRPKKIELQLILDLSGSMDKEKRESTQEAAYALAKSLIMFMRNMKAEFTREGIDSPNFDINLRLLGFGSTIMDLFEREKTEIAEDRLSDEDPTKLDNRLWRAIIDIGSIDLGNTYDSLALEEIYKKLQLQKGTKDIFIRGIRIPGNNLDETPLSEEEKDEALGPRILDDSNAFELVWGKRGERLAIISELKKVMQKILFYSLQQHNSDRDTVSVIIEVTDGETMTPNESKGLIEDIESLGN